MRALTFLATALTACAAHSAPFADPTRPPDAAARDAGAGAVGAETAPRLESILIGPDRRIAVISGKSIPLGGKYGESRVVRITEGEVVLRTGDKTETLRLLPAVEKKSARARARTASQVRR